MFSMTCKGVDNISQVSLLVYVLTRMFSWLHKRYPYSNSQYGEEVHHNNEKISPMVQSSFSFHNVISPNPLLISLAMLTGVLYSW